MQARLGAYSVALMAVLAVAGCASREPRPMMNLPRGGTGPDEFLVLPNKPLQMPKDSKALPEPTPGGENLADPTPLADAYKALGGRKSTDTTVIPAADSALVRDASRYGVTPGIRKELDAADLEFRRTHGPKLFYRMFGLSSYLKAYAPMSLNQYKALEYWRARGVRTDTAPPEKK